MGDRAGSHFYDLDASIAPHWEFVKHADGWTWRKLLDDGRIAEACSRKFRDCDLAHGAATLHGFRPREHHWMITTEFGTTHFRFPRRPSFEPRRGPDPHPRLARS